MTGRAIQENIQLIRGWQYWPDCREAQCIARFKRNAIIYLLYWCASTEEKRKGGGEEKYPAVGSVGGRVARQRSIEFYLLINPPHL